jgi:hypothetical protein
MLGSGFALSARIDQQNRVDAINICEEFDNPFCRLFVQRDGIFIFWIS